MKRVPKSPLRERLATNLRLKRAELGWSQERLAHEAGLNRTYLSAVERSEQNISIDNLWKLATALDTAPEILLSVPAKAVERT
ncbi:helix-turn-helix transcriptional regulator (plasmid) [Marivivens sp. LCG002]|uniref:helix-turn-helix domain-containing protein n=1 Tax=Marivivens sp. LCG002 TaxID=3051171 RepID=UPI00255380C9|nr:helix-turn-helix transcriptional regulator [Marivivens sp. LCG002]WIV52356.1 helix-turn-helix transcriptional regulator [Marivivens sp. LCG002]